MGTNYYLKQDVCEHCGRGDGNLHIGKSSAGWVFHLRIHPYDGINSLEDWLPLFDSGVIVDEYDREVSKEDMLKRITEKKWHKTWDEMHAAGPPHMYSSWEDFHERNGSMEGPDGLLVSRLDKYEWGKKYSLTDYDFC